MKRIIMVQGDLLPERILTLRGPTDGTSDLTTLASVWLEAKRIRAAADAPLKINRELEILDGAEESEAQVLLSWEEGDTDTPGTYLCRLAALDVDGRPLTFPNGDDGNGEPTAGHFVLQINPPFTP